MSMNRRRRRVAVLGCTGSIGRQTLDVIRWFPDRFEVAGLAGGRYSETFRSLVAEFQPSLAAVGNVTEAEELPAGILRGTEGVTRVATLTGADVVVVATAGGAGVVPTLAAVTQGKNVALANKESLVMAGKLVTDQARRSGARILPVDSEHSAIWQCLRGEGELPEWRSTVRSLILTASGGALRDLPASELDRVSPAQVLAHPTWQMGPKVTVDSATLMNKGLEVIEAYWLFGLPLDRVKLVLHRESIVHSMVEFIDGTVKAQLGVPDMRVPIQYALGYPERLEGKTQQLDLARIGTLTFDEINLERYPCLRLALDAARKGQSYPAVLSAANEVAVNLFLEGKIGFGTIPILVEEVLGRHQPAELENVEDILHLDEWARQECATLAHSKRRN